MKYITEEMKQYKANLHSHTVFSDGKLTPEAMVEAYRDKGYSVLAITDHEAPYDHSDLTTTDFLVLTGYEAYIRPTERCKFDPFGPEIHMNLFAKDPHNVTFVCYDPASCKYMPREVAETRPKAGVTGPRRYSVEYINQFIRTANENGYLVCYNHPCWSMEEESDVLNYEGLFSLEIYNTGCMKDNGYEHNMALFDKFQRRGKFIYCHGADDNHNTKPLDDPYSGSFGAWTMIMAKELTYPAVIEALENGDFYASTGPQILELSLADDRVSIKCSPAKRIMAHLSPKKALSVYNSDGSPVTEGNFEIPENVPFIYFSVIAEDGTAARTRAFRREEFA